MTDMKINGAMAPQGMPSVKPAEKEAGGGFDNVLQDAMGKLSQVQSETEKAVKELSSGGDPTEAILAMQKADMNFELMVEVRNKLIAAYEEVMRMQV